MRPEAVSGGVFEPLLDAAGDVGARAQVAGGVVLLGLQRQGGGELGDRRLAVVGDLLGRRDQGRDGGELAGAVVAERLAEAILVGPLLRHLEAPGAPRQLLAEGHVAGRRGSIRAWIIATLAASSLADLSAARLAAA